MTIATEREEGQVESLALRMAQDAQVQRLLLEALEAWERLQGLAALLREPAEYIRREAPWIRWDLCLRRCVRELGPALFEAALKTRQGQAAPVAPSPAPLPPVEEAPGEAPRLEPGASGAGPASLVWEEEEAPGEAPPGPVSEENVREAKLLVLEHREEVPSRREPATLVDAPPVPITHDIVARLQEQMSERTLEAKASALFQKVGEVIDYDAWAAAVLQRGHNMASVADGHQDQRLMRVLEHNATPTVVQLTLRLSQEVALHFFHMLVAYARGLQRRSGDKRLRSLFGKLRSYLKEVVFVYGMANKHQPQSGSWEQDAAKHWAALREQLDAGAALPDPPESLDAGSAQREVEALLEGAPGDEALRRGLRKLLCQGMRPDDTRVCRLLAEHQAALTGGPLKKLRKAIGKQLEADEREEEQAQRAHSATPPEGWPFWGLTQGKKAVMIGSQGKKYQLEAVRRAFGFSQLDQVGISEGVRRIQAMTSTHFKEDCVYLVMHRYVSHSASGPIWAKRDEAVVIGVDHGFSVGAVRLGIEKDGQRWLDRQLPPEL